MFGTLISINSKSSIKLDLIYLPAKKIIITRENISTMFAKPKKNNKISLLSTKCLNKNYRGSKYRMYGSSAYSFYKFIIGEANEYVYCEGAKIWDCFTGLRLASLINCKMKIQNKSTVAYQREFNFQTLSHFDSVHAKIQITFLSTILSKKARLIGFWQPQIQHLLFWLG